MTHKIFFLCVATQPVARWRRALPGVSYVEVMSAGSRPSTVNPSGHRNHGRDRHRHFRTAFEVGQRYRHLALQPELA